MLPTSTFPIGEMTGGELAGDTALNPLTATEAAPTPFADALRVSRTDVASPPAVVVTDELLPETGSDLPPGLETLVDELQLLQASLGTDALTEAELDVDLELTLRDLELPAGLTLDTPQPQIEVASINVASLPSEPSLLDSTAKSATPVIFVPPTAAQISDLSNLTRLPVEQIEMALERAGQTLSREDLNRVTEALQRLVSGTDTAAASRQSISPAATVSIDGVTTDARGDRFRSLGVGPLGLDAAERTAVSSSLRTELGSAVAELARSESAQLLKPQGTNGQVYAPAIATTTATSVTTGPADLSPTTLTDSIRTTVNDPAWSERLGERVLMMANNKLQNAELRLSPADMGPLRIRMSLEDNAATINFVAQHSGTREVIEAALPRLRALLEEQGINLGQASVGEQSADADNTDADQQDEGTLVSADARQEAVVSEELSVARRVSRGLLDTFV
ncbi:MAG: flagellar hook-length control protein FliK [Pseudomonadota bacterium]